MKILVTGVKGQLGHDVVNELTKRGHTAVGVDVEEIFNLSLGKFKTALKNSPKGVQQAVKNIAGEKIMNGSLDSLAKIKAIDDVLGTDLKLYLS